jgi:signal transduction histidine kinase
VQRPRPTTAPTAARAWSVAGTIGAVLASWFWSTVAVSFASPGSSPVPGRWILAWLVALAVGTLLVWRATRPVLVNVATAVTAIVLPLDALAALVALPWVISRRPTRTAIGCGALTAVAVAVALGRDHARPPARTVLATTDAATGAVSVPGAGAYALLGALLLAVSVGAGLVRRSLDTAHRAVGLQQQTARHADRLRTEMTRQEERELIAREVHDTVAHHLSLVSLHASALEVSRRDDEDVTGAARSIRVATRRALEEMRDLVGTLRDPQPPGALGAWDPAASHSLADLPRLVSGTREAGADVRARVFVTDGDTAPPALTRAVYRIVQESVTNALKHAPGVPVEVDVSAAPGSGVEIRVANVLRAVGAGPVATHGGVAEVRPGASSGAPGSGGAGLLGMRERAERLGGAFDAGARDGWFVVSARLPWTREPVSVPAPTVGA